MYYITNALVRNDATNKKWVETDISQLTLRQVRDTYAEGYIRLHRDASAFRWVDINTIFQGNYVLNWTVTLEMWLISFPPSLQIPGIINQEPSIDSKVALASDAIRSGYNIELVSDINHPLTEVPYADRKDILLTRFGTDYNLLLDNCLATVNGHLHRLSSADTYGVRIIKGGESAQKYNDCNVGLISFRTLGGLSQFAITEDMVLNAVSPSDPSKGFYLDLDTDITNKTLMLSIGGYLHTEGDVFEVINRQEGLVIVKPYKLYFYQRLFESFKMINLDSLTLTKHPEDDRAVLQSEVWTDQFIREYFTLPQSFAIVVNTPVVAKQHIPLESMYLPGKYNASTEPFLPLIIQTGLILPYWVNYEDGKYVVSVTDGFMKHYQYTTNTFINEEWIIPNQLPYKPVTYGQVDLVEYSAETIIWS